PHKTTGCRSDECKLPGLLVGRRAARCWLEACWMAWLGSIANVSPVTFPSSSWYFHHSIGARTRRRERIVAGCRTLSQPPNVSKTGTMNRSFRFPLLHGRQISAANCVVEATGAYRRAPQYA